MIIRKLRFTVLLGAVFMGAALTTPASIYLQYDSLYAGVSGGISMTYPWDGNEDGTKPPRSGIVVGIYNVSGYDAASGGTQIVPTWQTVCLSPELLT